MPLIRSMLIVPSLRPDLLKKSLATEADALMLELEDGVHESKKVEARHALTSFIRQTEFADKEITVRINEVRSVHGQEDIRAMTAAGAPSVMLAKIRSAEDVALADDLLTRAEQEAAREVGSVGLWCMIETTAAVQDIDRIARGRRLRGVLFGGGDLSAELRVRKIGIGGERNIWDTPWELLYARERVLIATRAAGITALDVPYTSMYDLEGTRRAAGVAAQLGFDGMAVISPRQIPVVHEEFMPSEGDLRWARAVVAAFEEANARGETVVVVEQQMIDGPFVRNAYTILQRHREADRRAALRRQARGERS